MLVVKSRKNRIYLLVMPKYWVKNYLAHGSFPEVGQKQKTEEKEERKRRERLNDGENNGQATHGARKHAWRTQAAWAKINRFFWLNLIDKIQKYWKSKIIEKRNLYVKSKLCFCSHCLPLRTLRSNFVHMVEYNVLSPPTHVKCPTHVTQLQHL